MQLFKIRFKIAENIRFLPVLSDGENMPDVTKGDLEKIVGHVSDLAIKHWLKISGLEYSAANEDQFYERLLKLINKGKLTTEKLQQVALEIEENGNKRIYLRQVNDLSKINSLAVFEANLKKIGLRLFEQPNKSIKYPTKPIVNYIWWSEKEIRIKYSETQIRRLFNYETGAHTDKKQTKFALAILDLKSGFTQIRVDSPEKLHSHKDKKTGKSKDKLYEEYYFNEFCRILGNCELELFNVNKVIEGLVKDPTRSFRLPHQQGITENNSHESFSSRIDKDLRDDPRFIAAAGDDYSKLLHMDLQGWWVSDKSNSLLSRDIFMQINRGSSMLRFLADCLASEVNYAISRIRQGGTQIPTIKEATAAT